MVVVQTFSAEGHKQNYQNPWGITQLKTKFVLYTLNKVDIALKHCVIQI